MAHNYDNQNSKGKSYYDIDFFKAELASLLESYNLAYRSYPNGDLGSLEQVIFSTSKLGGNFDFWGSGWLGVYLYDFSKETEICNLLLAPEEEHHNCLKEIVTKILSI